MCRRTQWTGCHGEERHGGDRGCGGCNGHGVMVRRDMEVTEIMDEDIVGRASYQIRIQPTTSDKGHMVEGRQ